MKLYRDRIDAGKQLARLLSAYHRRSDTLVLALPRGGVPVAFEISHRLALPLDVLLVRKLGVPGNEEVAMGAIAGEGICVLNQDLLQRLPVTQKEIEAVRHHEQKELERRNTCYRDGKPFPDLKDKTVILVDDGIATGYTMRAALMVLKHLHVGKIVLAVPLAAEESVRELKPLVDEIVCPYTPHPFYGVGQWYESFSQTTDEEVLSCLNTAPASGLSPKPTDKAPSKGL